MEYNKKEVGIILGISGIIVIAIILFLLFYKRVFTVTFNTNGGEEIASIEVRKNHQIGALPEAKKSGYIFLYWKSDDGMVKDDYIVKKDITIEAVYEVIIEEVKTYIITFDTDGGSSIPSQEVRENEKIKYPGVPIKSGYTFKMWTVDGNAADLSKPVNSDMTLKAYYEKKTTTTKKVTTTIKSNGNNIVGKVESNNKVKECTYDGELTSGVEYVYGDYTYVYKKEAVDNVHLDNKLEYRILSSDGWWAISTESLKALKSINSYNGPSYVTSTNAISGKLCNSINNKPILSTKYMFAYSNASGINLATFNTSKVADMSYMFLYAKASSLNLSTINTSNVTNMKGMFKGSSIESLDLKSFNTSKVRNMSLMFDNSKATSINIKSFNTSNVIDMSGMFSKSSVKSIDLTSFNTSNVKNMSLMFNYSIIDVLDLSTFDTSNVTNMEHMFLNAKANKGYARTEVDANRFNNVTWSLADGSCPSASTPESLVFTVK